MSFVRPQHHEHSWAGIAEEANERTARHDLLLLLLIGLLVEAKATVRFFNDFFNFLTIPNTITYHQPIPAQLFPCLYSGAETSTSRCIHNQIADTYRPNLQRDENGKVFTFRIRCPPKTGPPAQVLDSVP